MKPSGSSSNNNNNNSGNNGSGGNVGSQLPSAQYSCATLFDGIVALWRLCLLNPLLCDQDRREIELQLRSYHVKTIEKVNLLLVHIIVLI